jgi:phosphatidylglycerol---prolipoprotein diacylglyceryl transferase
MMIWNIDPVLFELGPFEIRYYGILFALGLLLAYFLLRHLCTKRKLSIELLDEGFLFMVLGLVIGARFGHIIFYSLDFYLAHPLQIIKVWEGGLSSHGAAIGTFIAYLIFLWKNKKSNKNLKFFSYLDPMAVAATIPIGMVRLGNFFNSEIVGRPSDLPWAVTFPRVDDIARHPSQIYEFLIGLFLFIVLYTLYQKKRKPGFFFALLLTLYFPLRFLVEFVKEYPTHDWAFNLTTGQLLSLPFALLGVFLLIQMGRKQ